MTFNVTKVKKEIEKFEKEIKEKTVCHYCKKKMELGAISYNEYKWGCYKNQDCEFRKKHGYANTIDLNFEDSRRSILQKQIEVYKQGYNDALKSTKKSHNSHKTTEKTSMTD